MQEEDEDGRYRRQKESKICSTWGEVCGAWSKVQEAKESKVCGAWSEICDTGLKLTGGGGNGVRLSVCNY